MIDGQTNTSAGRHRANPRSRAVAAVAAAAVALIPVAHAQVADAAPGPDTGFSKPFAGVAKYERFAPTKVSAQRQVNRPLGQKRADRLARALGFDKSKSLTKKQYALYISGRGVGGGTRDGKVAATLSELSVRYLTNTTATRLYRRIDGVKTRILLGSYGLIVDKDGMLESPANDTSPVRQINWVLAPKPVCRWIAPPDGIPCGYMGTWMRKNGARDTLKALYRSAYTREAPYGAKSQGQTEPHELVPNDQDGVQSIVGMSMAPSIWIVNFLLIYALNPNEAANMPARWTPIPTTAADAILGSPTGQVPYADYMALFPQ